MKRLRNIHPGEVLLEITTGSVTGSASGIETTTSSTIDGLKRLPTDAQNSAA